MKLEAASLLLLAAGGPVASDGYRYRRAEFVRNQVEITVVMYASAAEFRRAAAAEGINPRAVAWSQFDPLRPTCTIHMVEPARTYRPEAYGHELLHCLRGRWHDRNIEGGSEGGGRVIGSVAPQALTFAQHASQPTSSVAAPLK